MSHLKHILLGMLVLVAVAASWHRTDSSNVWGQEPVVVDDPSLYWTLTLPHELPFSDFDPKSKELYAKLVVQEAPWQTGLIHYLGLNRFTGKVNPSVNRTVRWAQTVSGEDGKLYRLYLADKDRSKNFPPDGAAYIVTDSEFKLVYWRGTGIHARKTSEHKLVGDRLPVRLTLTEESIHNADASVDTFVLSLDGIRWVDPTNNHEGLRSRGKEINRNKYIENRNPGKP